MLSKDNTLNLDEMNKDLLSLSLTLFSMQLKNLPQVCAIPFIALIIFLFLLLKVKLVLFMRYTCPYVVNK